MFESGVDAAAYLVTEGERIIADRQKEIHRLKSVIGPLRKMARASASSGDNDVAAAGSL